MGFFKKIKEGLKKTRDAVVGQIDSMLKSFTKIDDELFEELEELSNQGLMLSRQMGDKWCFHVSKEGMRFLENITAVAIIELDDSL